MKNILIIGAGSLEMGLAVTNALTNEENLLVIADIETEGLLPILPKFDFESIDYLPLIDAPIKEKSFGNYQNKPKKLISQTTRKAYLTRTTHK